jgi:DNA-directed RNA polymerase specialized sigma24 family protein
MTQAAAIALDPREILKADAASKDPFISKRLMRFCYARTRDVQLARDLASEAVVLTLAAEGWHRWSHDGDTAPAESLLMHLCTMARDVLKKQRESAAAWREVEGDPKRDAAAAEAGPPPGEKPVEWAKHDDEMRRAEAVMEKLDEDARRMLRVESESESEEELSARALAEKLGWSEKQVQRARERVAYHRDALLAREAKRRGRS